MIHRALEAEKRKYTLRGAGTTWFRRLVEQVYRGENIATPPAPGTTAPLTVEHSLQPVLVVNSAPESPFGAPTIGGVDVQNPVDEDGKTVPLEVVGGASGGGGGSEYPRGPALVKYNNSATIIFAAAGTTQNQTWNLQLTSWPFGLQDFGILRSATMVPFGDSNHRFAPPEASLEAILMSSIYLQYVVGSVGAANFTTRLLWTNGQVDSLDGSTTGNVFGYPQARWSGSEALDMRNVSAARGNKVGVTVQNISSSTITMYYLMEVVIDAWPDGDTRYPFGSLTDPIHSGSTTFSQPS